MTIDVGAIDASVVGKVVVATVLVVVVEKVVTGIVVVVVLVFVVVVTALVGSSAGLVELTVLFWLVTLVAEKSNSLKVSSKVYI